MPPHAVKAPITTGKAAKDTKGVFYLRIEDTDQKREVPNGIEGIVKDLKDFEIHIDEGALSREESIGEYGPYIQSERKEIYHAFIKHLISIGMAYPCFCSEEHLAEIREMQEATKSRIGYYGRYAVCRNIKIEDAGFYFLFSVLALGLSESGEDGLTPGFMIIPDDADGSESEGILVIKESEFGQYALEVVKNQYGDLSTPKVISDNKENMINSYSYKTSNDTSKIPGLTQMKTSIIS